MISNEKEFIKWIDKKLNSKIPEKIIAFNINIYESPFKVELVSSAEFTQDNED